MASPRKIITKLNQVSKKQFLQVPSTIKPTESPRLKRDRIINIDTPNRRRIVKQGLEDQKMNTIGVGGFGRVYRANYKGHDVAVKILKHDIIGDEIVAAEMHRANLKHRNIVRVIGCERGDALSMIMLELCGPSLHDLIEDRPLSREERVSFLLDVVEALKFCHDADIIHADVKPKNIFISAHKRAKLGDFGSSVLRSEKPNGRYFVKGTAGYEAPEVIRGQRPGPASDIYSLGVVAWQMVSRKQPFAGYHCHVILYLSGKGRKPEDCKSLNDEFGGKYKELYRKMWSTEVEDRPSLDEIAMKMNELQ